MVVAMGLMTVEVSFYGNLIRYRKSRHEQAQSFTMEQGTTVAMLLAELNIPKAELSTIAVNGEVVEPARCLCDRDHIKLFSLLSGG
jgi:sulfur carrier protein ThiS